MERPVDGLVTTLEESIYNQLQNFDRQIYPVMLNNSLKISFLVSILKSFKASSTNISGVTPTSDIDLPDGYDKPVIVPSNEFQKMCKDMNNMGNMGNMNNYNQQVANNRANTQGLYSLLGSAGNAYAGYKWGGN